MAVGQIVTMQPRRPVALAHSQGVL
eukprot:COSAG02_NODE_44406_length_366_cov_1.149813_2_plen_24_part_01